jgi:acyl-coenzyme A thioesterase PaaI-like protein
MTETTTPSDVDNRILRMWARFSGLPMGRFVFSRLFGRIAPFNSVISPRVLEVRPGCARIAMQERRRLHQHLRSVHAGALFTLAECTSGLTLSASIPDTMRIIVTNISIDFQKKAHGLLVAEGRCEIPDPELEQDFEVEVGITDDAGDKVASAVVRWRIGPRKNPGKD